MNLATRLFITMALLIAFAVGAALGLSYWLSRNAVENQVNTTFLSGQSVQRHFLEQELRELKLVAELIASDRAFVAYVTQALGIGENEAIDSLSISDLVNERSTEYGFDFALLLSPSGQTLVTTGNLIPVGRDLSNHTAIANTIESLQPSSGLWAEPERVLEFAIAPLINGRAVQAFLVTGTQITSDNMNRISRASGIEMAYISLLGDQSSIAATTLPVSEQDDLASQLSANELLTEQVTNIATTEPVELILAGQKWISQISPLEGNETSGRLMSMVPHAQLFQTFRDISNVLMLAGLAAIIMALIVSVTAAKRMLKPIESLAHVAEHATRGQYRNRIKVAGSEEIQRLQRAFNHLVTDLREQVAVASYFEELSQKQPINQELTLPEKQPIQSPITGVKMLPKGHVLGKRYEIIDVLGQGGMGIVYEAIDHELNEVIALKTMRRELASDHDKVMRLKSEMRLARRITHPNIVRTFDFARIDGIPLISMELVRGVSLEDAIRRYGRVEFYACIRLALQICDAVAAAHKAGVLHRDLKPGNVIITNVAKVMDFGIAHPSLEHLNYVDPRQSIDQVFEGTPTYLSPEQLLGEEVDERSDIYSIGILLTEMFTGHIPHADTDTKLIFDSHINRKLLLPSDLWPEIPTRLEATILQCLEKSRHDRWQSVEDLRRALEDFRLN